MARKKQEIQLQVELETQEDFDAYLQKPGLIIVDVYQEWCGPCKSIQGQFRKLKIESADADFIQLAVAKADTIDSLQAYRGKCEPCFLIYAGATLVAAERGVNPAKITRTIESEISKEKKVQAGDAEREEFFDSVAAPRAGRKGASGKHSGVQKANEPAENNEAYEDDWEEEETVEKEVTIVIMKPDLVASGRVEEAITRLKQLGLEVLEREERALAEDEITVLYQDHAEKEYFAELKEYMMSGPCVILAMSRETGTGSNIARELHDVLLGPPNVDEAREKAPSSLRAVFGSDAHRNGLHAASGREMAARELGFFFPGFSAPGVPKPKVQRTVAVIRPEAYAKHKDAILAKIHESGFHVAIQKEMQLTREQAEEYYSAHKDQPYFEQLVTSMISGPLLALALVKEDAVAEWRRHLGPGKTASEAREVNPFSLRAHFSVDEAPNALHGASSEEEAKRDEHFFFPPEQTLVAIKPDAIEKKEDIIKAITDAGFTVKSSKEMQLSEAMAQEFYRDHKDQDFFSDLVGHMANGHTTFLIIERDDAIMRFRELKGAKDPKEAPEGSLRKQFGKDVLQNAIHGSSSKADAQRCIDLIFGSDLGSLEKHEGAHHEGEQHHEKHEAHHEQHSEGHAEGHDKSHHEASEGDKSHEHHGEHDGAHHEKHEGEHHEGEHHEGEHHEGEHHEGEHHEGEHHEGEHHEGEHGKKQDHEEGHHEQGHHEEGHHEEAHHDKDHHEEGHHEEGHHEEGHHEEGHHEEGHHEEGHHEEGHHDEGHHDKDHHEEGHHEEGHHEEGHHEEGHHEEGHHEEGHHEEGHDKGETSGEHHEGGEASGGDNGGGGSE